MTIQYTIEVPGRPGVRVTQCIDPSPCCIRPSPTGTTVNASRPSGPITSQVMLPTHHVGCSPTGLSGSGPSQDSPDSGGGPSHESPDTGGGPSHESPDTGGGGMFSGLTLVFGPVILPSGCPNCGGDGTAKPTQATSAV